MHAAQKWDNKTASIKPHGHVYDHGKGHWVAAKESDLSTQTPPRGAWPVGPTPARSGVEGGKIFATILVLMLLIGMISMANNVATAGDINENSTEEPLRIYNLGSTHESPNPCYPASINYGKCDLVRLG